MTGLRESKRGVGWKLKAKLSSFGSLPAKDEVRTPQGTFVCVVRKLWISIMEFAKTCAIYCSCN